MESVLFIDPHTLAVEEIDCLTCRRCEKTLPAETHFYFRERTKCRRCYDAYWMKKNDKAAKEPLEVHLEAAVYRANRRSRFRRSHGGEITLAEAAQLWKECGGACCNCGVKLVFTWHPRHQNRDFAILDRLDTSANQSYAGNAQFLCNDCNTEKGGWDFVDALRAEVVALRKKKRKRPPSIPYASILIPLQ